jgi:hypothetical protein
LTESGICVKEAVIPCADIDYVFTNNGTCTDDCGDGFYLEDDVCKPCKDSCLTCTALDSCTGCQKGFDLSSGDCICNQFLSGDYCLTDCGEGFTKTSTPIPSCVSCITGCKSKKSKK